MCGLVYFNVSEGGNEIVSGISVVFFNMGDMFLFKYFYIILKEL